MIDILFSGCSFTAGAGLEKSKNNPSHYANVMSNKLFGDAANITNIGIGGNSNLQIFLDTSTEIIQKQYKFVFVGWTGYPRYVFWPGLEEYECRKSINGKSSIIGKHNGNDNSFTEDFLQDFKNKFLLLNNDHYSILDIVKYVNILKNIAENKGTTIYFLNNLCFWDNNYFNEIKDPLPINLTPYTNKILNSEHRDDIQIKNLYNKIHNNYKSVGGIQQNNWLNLYNSFVSLSKDIGNDNEHPGVISHQYYGNFLASKFKELNN
jgi:hypothetical protein